MENEGIVQQLKGKAVFDLEITESAVVIKFSDNTFLDIYFDTDKQRLMTSTNTL
ncbi:hypothetical protein [Shouchella miscanthi]|uniref:Uncharacterized protein n=1 Tax=Shouchella miscanthi TaxID=2598861 RepID=A0ABU6NRQ9_9BACI|nr:hypothetical protein [Shouchella miscanthi]